MMKTTQETMREEILKAGRITPEIKRKYFWGAEPKEIRNELERIGLDRHMSIELYSTEIALVTPHGIIMQIRTHDNNQLGLWGGVIKDNEEPYYGVLRELKEETGSTFNPCKIKFIEIDKHFHEYANGDKVHFYSYRYVLRLDYAPEITIDEESKGIEFVTKENFDRHDILEHQKDFINRVLCGKI